MHPHRPHVNIPGAWAAYDYDAYDYDAYHSPPAHPSSYDGYYPQSSTSTIHSSFPSDSVGRPISRSISVFEPDSAHIAFPEPQLSRSISTRSYLHPTYSVDYRGARSGRTSPISRPQSIADFSPSSEHSALPEEVSSQLDSDEGLRLFQENQLTDAQEQWHLLVPAEAQEALDKQEVQRQSVIFEVFKSEKDYTFDLGLVNEVFVTPLLTAEPPVMAADSVHGFISEVFFNLDSIAAQHQRMLAALFARQRDQHPLVQSVADIVLDSCLLFRQVYESYIKHYPLAEARHRSELRKNRAYQAFIQKCSQDPRIRKRDLITFLSRPVTRLPRLSLVLEHILKLTQPDHPDLENLPLILSILNEFVKSTQPGIEAAESKVKFWNLCENLVYSKGEILEMDLYDESRTVVHSGQLARHKSDTGWVDLTVFLLDNYLLLAKEEKHSSGVVKYYLVSRPLPLEYLCLGEFQGPAENRKEKSEDRGIFDSLRPHYRSVYPFTVYHASAKSSRRYTLCALTEASRQKWHSVLSDALTVRRVRQEGNRFFAPHDINDGFFRTSTAKVISANSKLTGKMTAVAQMTSNNKKFLVVGCSDGIYVGLRGESSFTKVLPLSNPTSIHALDDYNKVLVHQGSEILAYSSDVMARFAQGKSSKSSLDATFEKMAADEGSVVWCRIGQIGRRTMVIYACKTFLRMTIYAQEAVNTGDTSVSTSKRSSNGSCSFRSFGEPFSVPKDALDISMLTKTIGICTEKGIVITDPTNFSRGTFSVVPDFANSHDNQQMNQLKTRCESAKPLGLVRCDTMELLVIYDELGCYVTRHGTPSRSCGYIRWETKATSFAAVASHILLFSPNFVEIRHMTSGKLVQVIEGQDIKLLHVGYKADDGTVLFGMKGKKDDDNGASYKIVDLVETQELQTPMSSMPRANLWDMWDSV